MKKITFQTLWSNRDSSPQSNVSPFIKKEKSNFNISLCFLKEIEEINSLAEQLPKYDSSEKFKKDDI